MNHDEPSFTFKTAPVGPVAGGILGCFLIIALAIYCYRHHIHRTQNHYAVANGGQDNNFHLDNDLEDYDLKEDFISGNKAIYFPSIKFIQYLVQFNMNLLLFT